MTAEELLWYTGDGLQRIEAKLYQPSLLNSCTYEYGRAHEVNGNPLGSPR